MMMMTTTWTRTSDSEQRGSRDVTERVLSNSIRETSHSTRYQRDLLPTFLSTTCSAHVFRFLADVSRERSFPRGNLRRNGITQDTHTRSLGKRIPARRIRRTNDEQLRRGLVRVTRYASRADSLGTPAPIFRLRRETWRSDLARRFSRLESFVRARPLGKLLFYNITETPDKRAIYQVICSPLPYVPKRNTAVSEREKERER